MNKIFRLINIREEKSVVIQKNTRILSRPISLDTMKQARWNTEKKEKTEGHKS